MVLLFHWFIPYKVEREKTSFQCGTKEFKPKARQGNQAKKTKAKGKNSWVPTVSIYKTYIVIIFILLTKFCNSTSKKKKKKTENNICIFKNKFLAFCSQENKIIHNSDPNKIFFLKLNSERKSEDIWGLEPLSQSVSQVDWKT